MLNSIKTLKRYCKATLNLFFYKKKIDDVKKKITYRKDFLCQNETLLQNL